MVLWKQKHNACEIFSCPRNVWHVHWWHCPFLSEFHVWGVRRHLQGYGFLQTLSFCLVWVVCMWETWFNSIYIYVNIHTYGNLSPSFELKYKYDQHNSATAIIKREECLKQLKSPGTWGKPNKIILLEVGPGMRMATITSERIARHFQ